MKKTLASKILAENKENYNLISEHFAKTRSILWPEIEATARYIAPGSLVLDVGCGNGRLFPFITKNNGKYLGFDISENLIKIAQTKYAEKYFFVGDLLKITQNLNVKSQNHNLNLKTNDPNYKLQTTNYNVVYCLAVLHHIPSHDLRLQALKNLKALLKPNGILILSVWNLWQKKYLKYIIKDFLLKLRGKSKLDWGDCYIPYKIQNAKGKSQNFNSKLKINKFKNSLSRLSGIPSEVEGKIKNLKFKIISRYLHVFTLKELIDLIKTAGFQILEKKKTKGNLLLIAKLN